MRSSLLLPVVVLSLFIRITHAADPAPFEIREGDRVLLLGDTLLERENTYGYLETRMHEQFPERKFTVRNLSWAGDTPRGWSRASFDAPEKGWERLKESIAMVKPTVVFLGYGMAASLQEMTDRAQDITLNPDTTRYGHEPMSAARFKKELGELMDAIVALSGRAFVPSANGSAVPTTEPTTAPPKAIEDRAKPKGVSANEAEAKAPADAAGIAKIGTAPLPKQPPPPAAAGVRFILLSPIRHEDLRAVKPGLPDPAPHNALLEQYSKAIEELANERGARFVDLLNFDVVRSQRQVLTWPTSFTDNGIHLHDRGHVEFAHWSIGKLGWWDGKADSGYFTSPTGDKASPHSAMDHHAIRAAVLRKNDLFFHRFRPANSTYLFGFRKHEQGQNAKEMPEFDKLVEAADAEIDRIKCATHGTADAPAPGRVAVPPAASGVSPERTSATSPPASSAQVSPPTKVREGGTPSPAGGTPTLPGTAAPTPPPLPDFQVQDGYQIDLWAENPLLEKPTEMNWDAQGRLWICSSSLYPMIAPGEVANDKILILSDTDHDGKADKSEVFADGLLIPTGVVPDLVYVGASARSAGVSPAVPGNLPETSNVPAAPASAIGKVPESSRSTKLNTPEAAGRIPAAAGGTPALPTPPAPAAAACYVGQSTELLHFTDTDGDGKADTKRVVFSGFGTEDTHHIIHTLRWGPDGRLYFNQSIYIHSHLETPWGMVRLNSGGVFAYDPRTERVEVLFKGFCNPWGHAWDQWGQSFLTDGAGFQGVTWGIPGAMYFTYENGRKIAPSISPGNYPKFCGLELIHSPHFPTDWQGNAITCDFRAHRIVRFAIEDLADGKAGVSPAAASASNNKASTAPTAAGGTPALRSGYVTKEMPDLLRTSDVSFRPIDVKHGPDGALYIADWSNPVINHGEVDFRDPRRDKHMGRIWRVTKKDAPLVKWEPLVGKKNEELLENVLSGSLWDSEQSRRVLLSRATLDPVVEAEYEKRNFAAVAGIRRQAPEAFLDFAPPGTVAMAIQSWARGGDPVKHADPRRALAELQLSGWWTQNGGSKARSMYFRTAEASSAAEDNTARRNELWQRGISNFDPRVRIEAMRALSRIPTAKTAELVLEAALKAPPNDPHYEYAAWLSINDLAKPWTEAIASGEWKTEGREAQLAYGLKAIEPALANATLAKLLAQKKVPLDGSGPWFEIIGTAGGPAELQPLWDGLLLSYAGDCCETDETRALEGKAPFFAKDAAGQSALVALLTAARVRNVRPAERTQLAAVLFHSDKFRAGAVELAGLWKAPNLVEKLDDLIATVDLTPELRRTVFKSLRAHGSPEARTFLEKSAADTKAPDNQREAALALAAIDFPKAATFLPAVFRALPNEAAALPFWRELLAIKGAADLLASKPPADVPKHVAAAGVRAAREAGKNGAKLLAALTPLAGLDNAQAAPVQDFKTIAGFVKRDGDPARGELIYRRATLGCTTCHAIGGAGGKVGPDFTSLGASAPLDYIIESTLVPALKVKEGFNGVTLTLKDGTQASGIQARETAQEVFLRNIAGQEQSVPKAQIAATAHIGSIMPAGLVEQLADRERLDLFAFLGELGKPGPYDASKGDTARVWQLHPGTATDAVINANFNPANTPGMPAYTLVDGRLTKDLLKEVAEVTAGGAETALAVTQFQSNGKTRLNLIGAAKAYLDGQPLTLGGGELAPELPSGVHTLAVKLDVKQLPEVLRVTSPDGRFLGN